MRVLHVLGSFNNGGVENLLINLTKQQVRQGLDVGLMIVTNSMSAQMLNALDPQVKLLYVNKPVGNHNPFYLFKLNWMYHSFGPDILHLHSPYSIPYFFSFGRREKRFVHVHNNEDTYSFNSSINRYFAISKTVYDAYHHQIDNDLCTICYNGVDFSLINEKTDYSKKPNRFVQVGRLLIDTKGQDLTLNAFEIMIKEGADLFLEFWGDGPDKTVLCEMVREKGLDSRVKVVGDVDNKYVKQHLQDFDAAIFSSRYEGFGIAATEAMGVGLPVVLSNIDAHLEISDKGKMATLFEMNNYLSLTESLKYVIDHYSKVCEIANSTKKIVRTKYSIEEMSKHLLWYYKIY